MSEALKKDIGENNGSEWDTMAESVGIEQRLEEGEDPEKMLKALYEDGHLTPDFMEEHGSTLLQYGLGEEAFERYEKLARQPRDGEPESPEDKRRFEDEEPEVKGFETSGDD